MQYTSIDRIFSKIVRDFGLTELNEDDVIEWAGEALEAINAVSNYEEAVAFVEVKNHQCDLPGNFKNIIQVARNNNFEPSVKDDFCPLKIVEAITEEDETDTPIAINCNGEPENAYELAYYRPYFDLKYEYQGWMSNRYYQGNFSPIRLANHSFFNSLVCREETNPNDNFSLSYGDEQYSVIANNVLRFSFKEGQVAISYLRQQMDEETGYPLIPDHYSYTTAITKYIIMKISERDFYNSREGSQTRLQKAESDWHWYCKQASNQALMIKGVDEHQNYLDQRSYILPRNQYNSFFGNLSRPEDRRWNHTNNIYNYRKR